MIPPTRRAAPLLLVAALQALVTLAAAVGLALVTAAPASAAPEVYPVPASRAWTVDGHGWGHGRGMSQWSAYAQASQGRSAQQILDFGYPGTTTTTIGDPIIRVQLTVLGGAPLTVSPQAGLRLVDFATGREELLGTEPARLAWRVRAATDGMHVEWRDAADGRWKAHLFAGTSAVVAGPMRFSVDTGQPALVHLPSTATRRYLGGLIAVPLAGGLMNSVSALPMDVYLRGVVPAESSPSWPAESLKAQSVAARSYSARILRLVRPGSSWDICDTTSCQVYSGVSNVAATTDAAIQSTAGQVRTYGGQIINAQFSSSNGGWSVDGGTPYLVAQPDPWDRVAANPRGTWRQTLSAATIESTYPQLGTLRELQVLARDGRGEYGGRVTEVLLRGSSGDVRVTSELGLRLGMYSSWWLPAGGPAGGPPTGNVEAVSGTAGGVRLEGWALDPDTAEPIDVHVYLGGSFAGVLRADASRPDVAAAFPGFGDRHGFSGTISAIGGRHQACLFAFNVGPGTNTPLGCRDVLVPQDPFGSLDGAAGAPGGIDVSGWVVDPDSVGPTSVHVYVDGAFAAAVAAGVPRPDVGAVHPRFGPGHGFETRVSASVGDRTVCVFGINVGPGSANTLLGCRSARVVGGDPFGNLEGVSVVSGGVRADGWAVDPDTSSPVSVHVYVDGVYAGQATAGLTRPDVAAVHPAAGPQHGFSVTVPASPGRRTACVFAVNVGTGSSNPLLGCRVVG